jgi:hypothetical protein
MKVRALLQLLIPQDPDAEVFIVTQPSYPCEHSVAGVATRGALAEAGVVWRKSGQQPNDVLIAEGSWRRYGIQETWDVAIQVLPENDEATPRK